MVGLLEDVALRVPTGFAPGLSVVLLGDAPVGLGVGEYTPESVTFPRFELDAEIRLNRLLRQLAIRRLVRSAQDVSSGGLGIALAECALLGGCGAILRLPGGGAAEVALFSEDQGRAVVTCGAAETDAVQRLAAEHGVPAFVAGSTGGDRFTIDGLVDVPLEALREAWDPVQ
jgi:phosphoribosylformylglycinamidine synthase